MNLLLCIKRPFIWLSRFRHRCGYGVHSPFAFSLITDVIYEKMPYYAYSSLKEEQKKSIATHGQVTELAITPIGLFWGLFSAVTYALYILLPAKAIEKWGSLIVIGLGMLLGGLIFPIAIQAWKYELPLTGGNLLALFGLVFIGTVFAYTVFLKGTTMVGAVKGSLLASVEPVASVILTVLIMGDHFFAIDVLGMILIVLAVILISLKDLVALKKQEKIQR